MFLCSSVSEYSSICHPCSLSIILLLSLSFYPSSINLQLHFRYSPAPLIFTSSFTFRFLSARPLTLSSPCCCLYLINQLPTSLSLQSSCSSLLYLIFHFSTSKCSGPLTKLSVLLYGRCAVREFVYLLVFISRLAKYHPLAFLSERGGKCLQFNVHASRLFVLRSSPPFPSPPHARP